MALSRCFKRVLSAPTLRPSVGHRRPVARPLLTPADVARLLRLDNPEGEHARRWVREHVPHVKKIGQRTLRWFEQDVLDWVEQQGTD